MKKNRIIFTGGGTGGHVFPLISVIRNLKKEFPDGDNLDMYYIAPKDKIPNFSFTREGLRTKYIFSGKLRRSLTLKTVLLNIVDLIKIPIGVIQSIFHFLAISPDLIFSKGGYGSVPVTIAAAILRVPVILHESDATPGLANRLVARFSTEIFVSFRDTKDINSKKKFVVGNPIRKKLTEGDSDRAEKRFGLSMEKPIIMILGGSQGSERINDTILSVLAQLLIDFEVIHQCGARNIEEVEREAKAILPDDLKKYYHPFSFFNEVELGDAYKVADLIISRAGSGSIFEIAANKKPSILIPLPEAAQNHQVENAYRVAGLGAATVMEEDNLTPHFFLERIRSIFSSPQELEEMRQQATRFAKPEAGRIIAAYIKEFLIQY